MTHHDHDDHDEPDQPDPQRSERDEFDRPSSYPSDDTVVEPGEVQPEEPDSDEDLPESQGWNSTWAAASEDAVADRPSMSDDPPGTTGQSPSPADEDDLAIRGGDPDDAGLRPPDATSPDAQGDPRPSWAEDVEEQLDAEGEREPGLVDPAPGEGDQLPPP